VKNCTRSGRITSPPYLFWYMEKKASISCLEEFSLGYGVGRTMLKEGFFQSKTVSK